MPHCRNLTGMKERQKPRLGMDIGELGRCWMAAPYIEGQKGTATERGGLCMQNGAIQVLALVGLFVDYEIKGLEKIPEEGPALILYYHGALPVDYYYFVCRVLLQRGRNIHSVGDHFLFKIPGFKPLLEVFCVMHGPKEECVKVLKNGHLLAISPGGVREAIFSDESYVIIWGSRKGFAQVAIDAKVPIIPMFTRNAREGFRSLGGIRLFRWIYETFKIPFLPIYGGFPVKLCTYLGDPIPYDPDITATELAEKAKCAIESLIERHQRIPGNILRALLERFHRREKED
ncbi:hypothetical protein NDU88_001213 [Pleurodeles waltl]|uniref:Phospholipid/glycerol acyltransferase domain-containing protein n=1 Tax=Pleurodeles waltl TaxID=8319 RepID=A0AAV7US54_PLEWA|nr:hypothetical protein NDU88_001213 [Pleurodeles waltl]